jgi:hypothetical protein
LPKQRYKNNSLLTNPPLPKRAWYYPGSTIPNLISTLDSCDLSNFKYYESLSPSENVTQPRFFKQRSEKWFNARKGKINGSKAATVDYWRELRDTL